MHDGKVQILGWLKGVMDTIRIKDILPVLMATSVYALVRRTQDFHQISVDCFSLYGSFRFVAKSCKYL